LGGGLEMNNEDDDNSNNNIITHKLLFCNEMSDGVFNEWTARSRAREEMFIFFQALDFGKL
jgi:hypothetical protein